MPSTVVPTRHAASYRQLCLLKLPVSSTAEGDLVLPEAQVEYFKIILQDKHQLFVGTG